MSDIDKIIIESREIHLKATDKTPWVFKVKNNSYFISKKQEIYFLRKFIERDELPTLGNMRTIPQHGGYKEPPAPSTFWREFLLAHQCTHDEITTDCLSVKWKSVETVSDGLKYLCYHIASAWWWICFAALNYGILRSIGNEGEWEAVGQRCILGNLGFMVIFSIICLFRKQCRSKLSQYLQWKYIRWVVLYVLVWIGACFYMYPHGHAIWETRSLFEYLMEMVYILAYFALFLTTIAFIVIGAIVGFALMFTNRSRE